MEIVHISAATRCASCTVAGPGSAAQAAVITRENNAAQ